MICECSEDELKTICELCHNVLYKNIEVTPKQLLKLKAHKNIIRTLGSKQFSLKKKREKLKRQRGGFLSVLLPLLGTLASGVIGGLLNR